MAQIDYCALERESYGWHNKQPPARQLSASSLGTLLVCAWALHSAERWVPVELFNSIAKHELPPYLRNVVHIESRIDGPILRELEEMVKGAQLAGVLLMAEQYEGRVVVTAAEAAHLLRIARADFPDEVQWIEQHVSQQVPVKLAP